MRNSIWRRSPASRTFSDFHFHRLFRALTGEVLGDYLRRRRLEVAAVRLRAQHGVPVLQIALGVGFGSAEAFARAFRARFECSPDAMAKQQARSDGAQGRSGLEGRENRKTGGSRQQEFAMNVKLIDREPVRVAYLRHTGPYGPPIGDFWMETVAPWMGTNNLFGRERFGISLDDPSRDQARALPVRRVRRESGR